MSAATEISAAMVKKLRDATGAGMMECKRALQESGGDHDAAVKLLREKGMASAAKRADRETNEGKVAIAVDGTTAAIVAVGCETEPVSKNDEFQAFVDKALATVLADGPDGLAKLDEERAQLSGKLGENIQIVGAERMEAADGEEFAEYIHPPGKVGVLLKVAGGSPGLARQLALHISFGKPAYRTRDQVPAGLIEDELEILGKLPEVEGKPQEVREKMLEGMLNKRFYAEVVLAEQPWIHDTGLTVAKALAEGGLDLRDDAWFAVG